MKYKVGKTYDFNGENRRVIDFDGAGYPITEPSDETPTKDKQD